MLKQCFMDLSQGILGGAQGICGKWFIVLQFNLSIESESLVQISGIMSNPLPLRVVLRCQVYTKRLWTEFLGEAKGQGMPGLVVLGLSGLDSTSLIE